MLFLVFALQQAHAQKEAAVWYFGYNAGVDFNSGTPVALTDGQTYVNEGCATISDPNGNLMFYTDGISVWNRNHDTMPNGTGLKGDPSSSQSAIIVPKSDEPNIFYIFTVDNIGEPDGLQYNVVDMNLDGGLGDVTAQKNILLHTPVSEKVTAVAHANGNGVWVVTKGWQTNAYLSFLVNAAGVNPTPVVSNIGFTATDISSANQETHGYLKASPDGKFLALAMYGRGMAEICRFDAATGVVSDWVSLQSVLDDFWYYEKPYGVEFSPNSKVLYVGVIAGILQFDISNYDEAAISASATLVSPFNTLPPFLGALQTGIDGKIYVTRAFRSYLNVINDPNVLGMGCNYQEQVVDLGTGHSGVLGLPPFLTSYFDFGIQAEHFCEGDATAFTIDTADPIVSIDWDFGDGATSTAETPTHTYAAPGTYTVTVSVQTLTENLTKTKEITIYEVPTAYIATDMEVCTGSPTYAFDLSTRDHEILGAQSPTDFQLSYHSSLVDAENNQNPLPNPYTNTLPVETVYARIQHAQNPECFATSSFDLVVQQAPVVNTQHDWTVCDTDGDGVHTFDLSQRTPLILTNNDPAEFSVSYYANQNDLDTKTNPLALNHTTTVAQEEIFWRIENDTYPDCYGQGTFFLEVIAGVTAHQPADMEVCDTDQDGFFSFNLSTQETEILGTQSATSTRISFHASLADAQNGNNPLTKTDYVNTTPYGETVFVRVENTADASCYATTSFELRIFDSPMEVSVSDWRVCDTDNDGSDLFDLQAKVPEILGTQSAADFGIRFYETQADADTETNALVGAYPNTSNPQTLFYRITNRSQAHCYRTGSFTVEVSRMPTAYAPDPITVCDTGVSGALTLDLSVKDTEILNGQPETAYTVSYHASESEANTGSNPLPATAYTMVSSQETLYARVENGSHPDCFDVTSLELIRYPAPQPDLEPQYVICPDSPTLTLDGGAFESWSWEDANGTEIGSSRSLTLEALGSYSLTVSQTQEGVRCENRIAFEVVSSGAPEDFTVEVGDFSDVVTLTVTVVGSGEFEYSTDGETYQADNRLGVFPGVHTVYVRDVLWCRTIQKEVVALGYQKFFSPNNDAINEYWHVIGAARYPDSKLYIYDRYGKLIKQLEPEGIGWDGTFNGLPMPSSDYWFRYFYGDGQEFSGHFTLKR